MASEPKSADLVVFSILRDSVCAECGEELWKGNLLKMEKGRPLCMACADLDHLVFLPSGDAALTRRARKHSTLSAVVVHFSRPRKRYERLGLLVEEAALQRAEEDCLGDEEKRQARRARDEERRAELDRELSARLAAEILQLFPGCPAQEARAIAEHTAQRGSGRVGRTAAGRALDADALNAAVVAAIRHRHSNYDELLMQGRERDDARAWVRNTIDSVLDRWREAPQ